MTIKISPAAIMHAYRSGQSMAAIGRVYGCSPHTIRLRLRQMGERSLANGRPRSRPAQTAVDQDVTDHRTGAEDSARHEGLEPS